MQIDFVRRLDFNEGMLAPKSERPSASSSAKEISVETSYARPFPKL